MQYMVEHLGGSFGGGGSFRQSVLKIDEDDGQMSIEEFEAAFQDYQDDANQLKPSMSENTLKAINMK